MAEASGRLLWTAAPAFAIGSSGLTYALIHRRRALRMISGDFTPPLVEPVDRVVVVSGSCAPATEQQIRWAMANGFTALPYDRGRTLDEGVGALAEGRS